MNWLDVLKNKQFLRFYSILTLITLVLSLIFNQLGFIGDSTVKGIASTLIVTGIVLLFGQVLISMNIANRKDRIGWIIVRFSYVTIFVAGLGLLAIALSTFMASMYLVGANSTLASVFISANGFAIMESFGVCLAAISFHTLTIDDVWCIDE
ncbi:MAG: hypothetical protein RTU92_13305 [Candidatus Thorarchaeota archaeon]